LTSINSNIKISGQGAPVVLIHGLGGNLQSWDFVANQLNSQFRVIRYDLRGHGETDNPKGPWVLDDFINDLKQILQSLNIEQCALVGFSLGGLISQGFAIQYPEYINKLVILSAVAGRTEAERLKVVERVRNLEEGNLDTNIELAMDRWFSPKFRETHPEKVQARINVLQSNAPQGYLNAYRVFGHGDLADELHKISCPTLVMTGEFDPGSNVRMSQLMHAKIPNSKLEILPILRHSVLVEGPDIVAKKLNKFL
jgi:pimeloyl-ACP methyl ester carboxylesterase